ncbi:MAG: efflux RND transporter periplasmic adaptor subunit [Proteobacteria bacterium]|nr:efflux RND transporter periplasmic adaptor subunit [Pseudomonadota bacterium]
MRKRSVVALSVLAIVVVVGVLGGIKALQIRKMIAGASQFMPPPEPVTTVRLERQSWESLLTTVGSLAAVQGVNVSAELSGRVTRIAFEAGTKVRAGALVQQDVAAETAQLRAIEARLALANSTLDRVRRLLAKHAVPASEHDLAAAQASEAAAEADALRATITKKTIRAPFSGRLGLRQVNLGQVLNAGEPIVLLQSIGPVYVNFLLPQQHLQQVALGLPVRITTSALPGAPIVGTITAVTPQVDPDTRSVELQATVPNSDERLRPGMFVKLAVVLPRAREVVALPATAVLYAPYSDSVFVLEAQPPAAAAGPATAQGPAATEEVAPGAQTAGVGVRQQFLRQQFVRLGERRGDYVAVLDGLKAGQAVVSTGVFKLRNGQAVVVDNTLNPSFKLAPTPSDS